MLVSQFQINKNPTLQKMEVSRILLRRVMTVGPTKTCEENRLFVRGNAVHVESHDCRIFAFNSFQYKVIVLSAFWFWSECKVTCICGSLYGIIDKPVNPIDTLETLQTFLEEVYTSVLVLYGH